MRLSRKRVVNPAITVRVLAHQVARDEVKDRLKRNGVRLKDVPLRELHRLTDEHLKANGPKILEEVEARYGPLLAFLARPVEKG
jgi:hypothetical protein